MEGSSSPAPASDPPPLGLPSAADDADARWLRVFNSCPVALSLTRWDDRTFVEVNSAFLTLLEWTRDEVIGQTPVSLGILDPDSAGRLRERLRTATPVRDVEGTIRTRSGTSLTVLCSVEVVDFRGAPHSVTTFVDISEQRAAEEELRVSKARLQAIFNQEPESVAVIDAKGFLTDLNPAGLALLEVRSIEEARDTPMQSFLSAEHGVAFAGLRERVMSGASGSIELRVTGRGGTPRWVETHATPLRDASGNVTAMLNVSRDITGRRQAEQRIRYLNRMYAVLSAINQAIVRAQNAQAMLDAACRIAADKGAFEMVWIGLADRPRTGLRITAHAGASDDTLRTIAALVADPDAGCEITARAMRTGQPAICNDIAADDTTVPWRHAALERHYRAMASLPLRSDGRVIGTFNLYATEPHVFDAEELSLLDELAADISFALDVHEREAHRRRVTAALEESEERFRQLAENIQETFLISEPQSGRFLHVSPAYEKIWGRPAPNPLDEAIWLEAVHAEDQGWVTAAMRTKQVRGDFDETYRILRPDGAIRWVHHRAVPLRTAAGEVFRIVGTAEDVTEHRQLEEQLRQSQKMDAVGQLAGGIAHDVNNIMTVIQGHGSLLLDQLAGDPRAQSVREVVLAADRAANVTRQLLTFSRQQVMQPRALDLNEVVTNLAGMLRRAAGPQVDVRITCGRSRLVTRADSGMLEQAVLNLVINARDAMPDGGSVLLETGDCVLDEGDARRLDDARPGRYVWLRVTDSGSGIAPQHRPHIFEPFFTTKAPGKGTGLGLATVFGIVKQHRGAIKVTTEVGHGTTFELLFPAELRAVTEPLERERAAEATAPPRGSGTVLVVEDHAPVRDLVVAILRRQGYTVLEAANGAQAVTLWDAHGSDVRLVLTDLTLPDGIGGRELAERFGGLTGRVPFVFMSGHSTDFGGREFMLEEGLNFLQKPFAPRQLLATVSRALSVTSPDSR